MLDNLLLLTVEDTARALNLSRTTVYELIRSGRLPTLKIGRSRRILAEDLERWVREQAREQNTERGDSIGSSP